MVYYTSSSRELYDKMIDLGIKLCSPYRDYTKDLVLDNSDRGIYQFTGNHWYTYLDEQEFINKAMELQNIKNGGK